MQALSRLSKPPEEVDVELDVATSRCRVPTVDELCEAMLRRQLRAQELLEPLDGTEEGPEAEAEQEALQILDDHSAATPSAPSGPPRGASAGGAAASADGGEPPAKRQRSEGREADEADGKEGQQPLLSIEEIRKLWGSRVRTASAALASKSTGDDFVTANRSGCFCVYTNCVQGDPHVRWVERVAARYGLAPESASAGEGLLAAAARVPEQAPRIDPGEVVLTVAVCNSLGHKDQEFEVLASQHLYELRDALYFASDWMFDGPTRIKSACFFIDGIFYSDMRDPTAIDYSTEIIEFMKQTSGGSRLRRDTSLTMDVRLCDLDRIPLGERCVYIHQGDIEHSVYFTQARLANPLHDCPFVEAYPVLTFMRRHMKRRCYVCWQNFAMWIVLDSHRCPHNPSFWCAQCFRHFHQDADGHFLCPVDYKVFPYLHDDV